MMKLIILIGSMHFMVSWCSMISIYVILCFLGVFLMLLNFKFDLYSSLMMVYSDYINFDKSSYTLVMLTLWILGLMFMSLDKTYSFKECVFIFMLLVLVMFFCSSSLLMMYLFFELSLIPTYLVIVYWGYNPERLSASFYLLIYMLLVSLPFLFYIYYVLMDFGSLTFCICDLYTFKYVGWWDYLVMTGSFLIKMPIYMFHVWLPKAHVEAPVYGSMILAAILLKMGVLGLYRIILMLKFDPLFHLVFMSLGLIGGVLVSFLSMIQVDMKSLVAYSSVVHMNLMMAGLLTLFGLGWSSCLMIMVSHGLCSSGLFYMVNMYYDRSSSRLLVLNKGMVSYIPMVSLMWFILCSSNLSFPMSLNFFGEITMLMTLLSWDCKLMLIMSVSCFFSGAYSLYLFSYVHHGQITFFNFSGSVTIKETVIVIYHYLPLVCVLLDLFMFY
nr:TPA_asm: NADH dehydrogenase subunit 4 [Pseudomyrmex concolor]